LVNEAWMKLSASPGLAFASPLHFKRVAARAMRQVLIESARRRQASKRGGDVCQVTFTESIDGALTLGEELLALDEALDGLARISPRQAQMVESRFFGGLEIPEIAELLGVSEATVHRDWRASRAWLARELRRGRPLDARRP
jgi:RNA polymerase sigma factor (TIGR02999 family)